MPEYLAPGVYVEETSFRAKSIEGVGTSTTAFVGPTRKGPFRADEDEQEVPELLTSFGDFERIYGGISDLALTGTDPRTNYLAHAVLAFFNEGGSRLYVSRGVREPGELDHALAGLPPPALMMGVDAAAQRLVRAIDLHERIVIVADYDADGATACAIGLRALSRMGADVRFLVPNRFEHGYGLTPEIVALAHGMGARLLVTVDNGIASV